MITLTDDIKRAVDNALADRAPMIVAYADADGQPQLSYRGTVQAWSDEQLAFWVRHPEGGILRAIPKNPRLALLYAKERTRYQFQGRARIVGDEEQRRMIDDRSPEAERTRDPERKGVAVIVDLDLVQGGPPDARIRMTRDGQ